MHLALYFRSTEIRYPAIEDPEPGQWQYLQVNSFFDLEFRLLGDEMHKVVFVRDRRVEAF